MTTARPMGTPARGSSSATASLRLAMLYDYPFRRDVDGLWTQRAYGHYVDALAPYFESVLIFAPVAAPEQASLGYRLHATNADLACLPFYTRWTGSVPAILRLPLVLMQTRSDWDAIYVRLPCPLAISGYPVARLLGRPICLHLVGDLVAQMANYPALVRPFARLAGRVFEGLTSLMARRALTIAQGDALTQQYSGPERVVVNLLESPVGAGEIWVRESTALHEPIRLLYVGALLEKKAVHLLVEAVAKLASEVNITLELVGSGPTEVQLRAQALQLGIGERVTFVGPVGSDIELMKHYRAADVFVMPSSAEGVPRVLLEAMAQSLPVVSTAVGGVPDLIRDGWNGVLVEPNSVGALCTAIRSVVHDQTLRQRLMAHGLETVRLHTREAHAAELVRVLGEYLRTHSAVGGGSVGASDAADSRE